MAKQRRVFRLLPVLLAAAVLLLGVKVHDVVRAAGRPGDALGDRIGACRNRKSAAARALPGQAGSPGGGRCGRWSCGGEGLPASVLSASGHSASAVAPAPAPAPAPPSAEELQVLQQLSARRQTLDARADELDRRADLLRAGEARLDQKLREMKEMQTLLQGLLKSQDAQQEAQMRSLVKIYENMKPRDAARIFEELEMATLLPVVERMGERRLAPVMADMNPAKARKITEELARLRQLSRPSGG